MKPIGRQPSRIISTPKEMLNIDVDLQAKGILSYRCGENLTEMVSALSTIFSVRELVAIYLEGEDGNEKS